MMSSLLDLISANQPQLQTNQALLVIGLQNDFLQPDGRLPVDQRNGFLQKIISIVPHFREQSAHIVWTQTLYEADRLANDPAQGEGDAVVVGGLVDGVESSTDEDDAAPRDLAQPTQSRSSRQKQRALDLLKKVSARRRAAPREATQTAAEEDEELFLLKSKKGPACMPNTKGAELADDIRPHIQPSDIVMRTTNYSAFLGTSLLLILRAKLVTELFICGCLTNVSVLATVVDAARHGFKINIISDAIGFRKKNRHDEALKRMVEFFDVNVATSEEVREYRHAREDDQHSERTTTSLQIDADDRDEATIESYLGRLRLDDSGSARTSASGRASQQPSILINGRQRTMSDASVAESRATTDTKVSDEQFAEVLSQGAKLPKQQPSPPAAKQNNLVKTKVRMRSRGDKSKKDDEKRPKAGTSKSPEPSGSRAKGKSPEEPSKEPAVEAPPPAETTLSRPAVISKAESSDRLRESPAKREQSLKSSSSQPVLSAAKTASKSVKHTPSRMRLALSRSSKSDITTQSPQASPKKEQVEKNSAGPAPQTPTKPTNMAAVTPAPAALTEKGKQPSKKLESLATFPVLRPGDHIAEGDSRIIYDFFDSQLRHPTDRSKPLKDIIFHQLYTEVRWQKMKHQTGEVPRLLCCQGEFGVDGSMPVYRHPSDQALPLLHFSPKVQVIRKQAEKLVGHRLNHVLIQMYRSGQDYISEHSDKTLDIVQDSSIVNVSFGAQRTMRLRTKKGTSPQAKDDQDDLPSRTTQRVAMPHNSMFVLGLKSNKKWLHGINPDKRIVSERSKEELAYDGMRISLTFRHIGTFLDAENSTIWGQGATAREQREASDVVNDDEDDNEKIVRAFSRENHDAEFDWAEWYGEGFDVLHFREAPEDIPILFAGSCETARKAVQAFLWESKINHTLLDCPIQDAQEVRDEIPITYRDNDTSHAESHGLVAILLYLDYYHPLDRDSRSRSAKPISLEILTSIPSLLALYKSVLQPTSPSPDLESLTSALDLLEETLSTSLGPFIAGRRLSVADFALWCVLDRFIGDGWEIWTEVRFPRLTDYYRGVHRKKKVFARVRERLPEIRRGEDGV